MDLFENVDITTRVGPIGTSYISKIVAKLDKMPQPAQSAVSKCCERAGVDF